MVNKLIVGLYSFYSEAIKSGNHKRDYKIDRMYYEYAQKVGIKVPVPELDTGQTLLDDYGITLAGIYSNEQ